MVLFEYRSVIVAPVENVFAFHELPDAIERLTPPWQRIEVVRREGGLAVGSVVEFRIPIGPFWVRWVAHHIGYRHNHFFIDEQREGPFSAWVHVHDFRAHARGTTLTDSIEFSVPGGLVVEKLFGWAIRWQLSKMFTYRHAVTKKACEK